MRGGYGRNHYTGRRGKGYRNEPYGPFIGMLIAVCFFISTIALLMRDGFIVFSIICWLAPLVFAPMVLKK